MFEQPDLYNADCMEAMKQFPDNFFDLAIVDPPYGGAGSDIGGGKDITPLDCERKIKITRTGGTWASKYAKKS
jgi:site-specific DNA-methyltransferase (adenine-specific)